MFYSSQYKPRIAAIELTLRCNMHCIHCGSSAGNARPQELTREEWKKFFLELKQEGGEEICILGGEPFLREDWEEVTQDACEAGLRVVIITNGLILGEEIKSRLKKIPSLDRIGVSLDGASPDMHDYLRQKKGAFKGAISAIELLRDAGIETGAITTLMGLNFNQLKPLRDVLAGKGLAWQIQIAGGGGGRFSRELLVSEEDFYRTGMFIAETRKLFSPHDLFISGSHDIGYFSKYIKGYSELADDIWEGCGAGIYTVGVESNGTVKGCLSLSSVFAEGNLREEPFRYIWNDPLRFQRNRSFIHQKLCGYCSVCRFGMICRAGCQELAFTSTGSPYANIYCFHRLEEERGLPEILSLPTLNKPEK